jgi:ATP-binding cassette subfamily B protein
LTIDRSPTLVRKYFRRYRRAFALGSLLLVLTNAAGLAIPWLLKLSVEALSHPSAGARAQVSRFALLIVGAALFQMVVRIGSRLVLFGAGRDIEFDIRNELLAHLATLPPSYFAGQSSGDIISRASNDIGNVRLLFGPSFLNIVNTGFTLVATLTMMLIIDMRLTLLALVPVPFVLLAVRAIASSLAKQFFEVQQYLGLLSGRIQETLQGALVVQSFAREDWARASFGEANEENFRRNLALARTRGLMMPMMAVVGGLGTFIIVFFGARAVIEGRISLGDFVAFNGYLAMLVWPMLALAWVFSMLQRGLAAARRVEQVLDVEPAIRDAAAPLALPPGGGAVRFAEVTVSHAAEGGRRRALNAISFAAPAGAFVGVTGPVGAGKSTLLRVLLRLQETDGGEVTLDGAPIAGLALADLRGAIAYVPQEPFLFSTSIRDNIAFGKPGLTQAELDDAAYRSGLVKDLPLFPQGYETVVGERGITLSGGQRQRVALARALARSPRLLLLDDALSAVDAETEEEIVNRLEPFMAARTSIVATHRLATIRRASRILVLDRGELIETGTHEELLAHGGLYAKLWERQQLARQIEAIE